MIGTKNKAKFLSLLALTLIVIPAFSATFNSFCSDSTCSLVLECTDSVNCSVYFPNSLSALLNNYFSEYSEAGSIFAFQATQQNPTVFFFPTGCITSAVYNGTSIFFGWSYKNYTFVEATPAIGNNLFLCNFTGDEKKLDFQIVRNIFNDSIIYYSDGNYTLNTSDAPEPFNYTWKPKTVLFSNQTKITLKNLREEGRFCGKFLNNTNFCAPLGNGTFYLEDVFIFNITLPVFQVNQTADFEIYVHNFTALLSMLSNPEPVNFNISITSNCSFDLSLLSRTPEGYFLQIAFNGSDSGCTFLTGRDNSTFSSVRLYTLKKHLTDIKEAQKYLYREYLSWEAPKAVADALDRCVLENISVEINATGAVIYTYSPIFGWRVNAYLPGDFASCWINTTESIFLVNSTGGVFVTSNSKSLDLFYLNSSFKPAKIFYSQILSALVGWNGTDYAILNSSDNSFQFLGKKANFTVSGVFNPSLKKWVEIIGQTSFTCIYPGIICSDTSLGAFNLLPIFHFQNLWPYSANLTSLFLSNTTSVVELRLPRAAVTAEVLGNTTSGSVIYSARNDFFVLNYSSSGVINFTVNFPIKEDSISGVELWCANKIPGKDINASYALSSQGIVSVAISELTASDKCAFSPIAKSEVFYPIYRSEDNGFVPFTFALSADNSSPVLVNISCAPLSAVGIVKKCEFYYTEDSEILEILTSNASVEVINTTQLSSSRGEFYYTYTGGATYPNHTQLYFYLKDITGKISSQKAVNITFFNDEGPIIESFALVNTPKIAYNSTPVNISYSVVSDANISEIVINATTQGNGFTILSKTLSTNVTQATLNTIYFDASPHIWKICLYTRDVFGFSNHRCIDIARYENKSYKIWGKFTGRSNSLVILSVNIDFGGESETYTATSSELTSDSYSVSYSLPDFSDFARWELKATSGSKYFKAKIQNTTPEESINLNISWGSSSVSVFMPLSSKFNSPYELIVNSGLTLEENEYLVFTVCEDWDSADSTCRTTPYTLTRTYPILSWAPHGSYPLTNLHVSWSVQVEEEEQQEPVGGGAAPTATLSLSVTPEAYTIAVGACEVIQFVVENSGNETKEVTAEIKTSLNPTFITASISPTEFSVPAGASKNFLLTVCPQIEGTWDIEVCVSSGTLSSCKTISVTATTEPYLGSSNNTQGSTNATLEKSQEEQGEVPQEFNVSVKLQGEVAEIVVSAENRTVAANITIVYADGSTEHFEAPTGKVTFVPKDKRFKVIVSVDGKTKEINLKATVSEVASTLNLGRVLPAMLLILLLIGVGVLLNAQIFL